MDGWGPTNNFKPLSGSTADSPPSPMEHWYPRKDQKVAFCSSLYWWPQMNGIKARSSRESCPSCNWGCTPAQALDWFYLFPKFWKTIHSKICPKIENRAAQQVTKPSAGSKEIWIPEQFITLAFSPWKGLVNTMQDSIVLGAGYKDQLSRTYDGESLERSQ